MSGTHPDPVEIAALGEELLPAAEAAGLRAHLAECTDCTAVAVDLEMLREELGSFAPIEPMPEEIARRIDTALAAEAPRPRLVSRETSRSADEQHRIARRRGRPQYLLAAAGAVVALGVGGLVLQVLQSGDAENGTYSAGTADSMEREEAALDSLEDQDVLESEVRGLLLEAGVTPEDLATENEPDGGSHPNTTGESGPGIAGSDDQDEDGDGPENSRVLSRVPSCISSVIDRTEPPLAAAENYRYNGVESYLVVLPHSQDPEVVDAYVVDATCAEDGSTPQPDDLLTMQSYLR